MKNFIDKYINSNPHMYVIIAIFTNVMVLLFLLSIIYIVDRQNTKIINLEKKCTKYQHVLDNINNILIFNEKTNRIESVSGKIWSDWEIILKADKEYIKALNKENKILKEENAVMYDLLFR